VSLLNKAGISTFEQLKIAYEENKELVSSLAEDWAEWEKRDDDLLSELNFKYGEDGKPDLEPEIREVNAGTFLYLLCQVLLVSRMSESDFETEFGDYAWRIRDWYECITPDTNTKK
jgi:outer membrane receptor for ferric coprogen and ferric-rhodotorulic acid